jgi:gamma-glutamyltranspeptidase/glutathione hydrolase
MVRILEGITLASDTGQKFFAPKGKIARVGSKIFLPGAATYFQDFAEHGAEPFYRGALAQRMLDAVHADGGYLTAQDLAEYSVRERRPARGILGDIELYLPGPPNLGGPLISFGLALLGPHVTALDQFDEQGLVYLCSAMATADAFRVREMDPLLLREYREPSYADDVLLNQYRDEFEQRATDPSRLSVPVTSHPIGSTTHISVVASDGSVCSVTTSNGEGSTIWLEDQGILLNNMVGEEDLHPGEFHQYPAGVRLPSMMSPTIAIARDGRTVALGSGGSNRLRSAILQVTLHHLGRGLSVKEATEHPRIHLENGVVDVEPGFNAKDIKAVQARGVNVHRWKNTNLYFGGVHAASMTPENQFEAAGDPRRGGVSQVVQGE